MLTTNSRIVLRVGKQKVYIGKEKYKQHYISMCNVANVVEKQHLSKHVYTLQEKVSPLPTLYIQIMLLTTMSVIHCTNIVSGLILYYNSLVFMWLYIRWSCTF